MASRPVTTKTRKVPSARDGNGAFRTRGATRCAVALIAGGYPAAAAILAGGSSGDEPLARALLLAVLQVLCAGSFFLLYLGHGLAEEGAENGEPGAGETCLRIRSLSLSILSVGATFAAVYVVLALEIGLWLPRSVFALQAILGGVVLLVWLLPSALLAWSPELAAPVRPGDPSGPAAAPRRAASPPPRAVDRRSGAGAGRRARGDVIPLYPRE